MVYWVNILLLGGPCRSSTSSVMATAKTPALSAASARRSAPPPGCTWSAYPAIICYNGYMRVLFIGGTGIISTACTRLAAERGIDITLLTRGQHAPDLPANVRTLKADIDDPAAAARALENTTFDAVVD